MLWPNCQAITVWPLSKFLKHLNFKDKEFICCLQRDPTMLEFYWRWRSSFFQSTTKFKPHQSTPTRNPNYTRQNNSHEPQNMVKCPRTPSELLTSSGLKYLPSLHQPSSLYIPARKGQQKVSAQAKSSHFKTGEARGQLPDPFFPEPKPFPRPFWLCWPDETLSVLEVSLWMLSSKNEREK